MGVQSTPYEQVLPLPVKMLLSGIAASVGEAVTIPFDTIKVYKQIYQLKDGVLATGGNLIKNEGLFRLHKGLVAGLQR